MTFAIKGNTEVPKKELKHKIERLGGTVVENMDKTTTACVSTKGAELSSETDAYIVFLCRHAHMYSVSQVDRKQIQLWYEQHLMHGIAGPPHR